MNFHKYFKQTEHGRSMVEMLGVLAVIGVLSIGGIAGYTLGMNKYRANQLINEINIASHSLATMLMMNEREEMTLTLGNPYDQGRIGTEEFMFNYGCGRDATSESECPIEETGYWMTVNNVPEGVCRSLMDSTRHIAFLIDQKVNDVTVENGANCVTGNFNQITWFFDVKNESGVAELQEGETNQSTDCGENGTWNAIVNACACNKGWTGRDCTTNVEENCKFGFINDGRCICDYGLDVGGELCDQDIYEACNFHGVWDKYGRYCQCSPGWTGTYCQTPVKNDEYCNYGKLNNNIAYSYHNDDVCICDIGYTGKQCDTYEPDKCGPNKVWVNQYYPDSNYTGKEGYCDCPVGKSGANCDKTVCSGHGRLSGQTCYCEPGWGEADCSQKAENVCSGNGILNQYSKCSCYNGWTGSDCSQKTEKTNCNHGKWIDYSTAQDSSAWRDIVGYCLCDEGWAGQYCDQPEEDVCVYGEWVINPNTAISQCLCYEGYAGDDCSKSSSDMCSGHGTWYNTSYHPKGGYCSCRSGYTGLDCSMTTAQGKEKCSNHGTLKTSYNSEASYEYCRCESDYTGLDCSLTTAQGNAKCSNHGDLRTSTNSEGQRYEYCSCYGDYTGPDCTKSMSDLGQTYCSGHGTWTYSGEDETQGKCSCTGGYGGTDCSIENKCSGHGSWYNSSSYSEGGYCYCNTGWYGSDCSQKIEACSGNGYWYDYDYSTGYCSCNSGWSGSDCSQSTTEANNSKCSGKGSWKNYNGGYCDCHSGYAGEDCSKTVAQVCGPNGSSWYGYGKHCYCKSGYTGKDCSMTTAQGKEKCSGHGNLNKTYDSGVSYEYCSCDSGYAGKDCSKTVSEVCNDGYWNSYSARCSCNSGYVGEDCSKTCQNGYSSGNECKCNPGWSGVDCSVEEKIYCKHGIWAYKSCLCEDGWTGENCDIPVI